ncbi:MAG: methyltransferase domain-containing protein [Candidatus Hodarchaeota archaeon]
MAECESFGVDYERYALGKLFFRLVKRHNIRSVLEIPASGAKAAPSIYSIGFGLAGCDVTLINAAKSAKSVWETLGLKDKVHFVACSNIEHTDLENDSFDFVWNFATFPTADNHQGLLCEMRRVSKKYVAAISVNRYNIGFPIHRAVHRYKKIPWTHGDIRFNSPRRVKQFFAENKLTVVEEGLVDCPPWPDSLGFRDVRLHRMNTDLTKIQWRSKIVDHILTNKYPKWMKIIYGFESIPVPRILKLLYSHLFYVLGKKRTAV